MKNITMLISIAKFNSAYLLLFVAFLGFGWARDVSNDSQARDLHVRYRGSLSPKTASTLSPLLSEFIRLRRATPNSCLAPRQPANGEYRLEQSLCDDTSGCHVPRGTSLEPGSHLMYRCNLEYKAKGNTDVYCSTEGRWSAIPECIEIKCDSLNSVSTMVSCTHFNKWINCDAAVPPETRAEVSCRHGYRKDTGFITSRKEVVNCNFNGQWEPEPIRCVPFCGVTKIDHQPLIIGGTTASVNDFPWHASLFVQKNSNKVFTCGATIVHTALVLTAAHCVYDERTKTTRDPNILFVITGNIFRDYDSPAHNPDVVRKAAVKDVHMYCQYHGLAGNYYSDIAILILAQPLEFSSTLLPACLDDSGNSEQFLESGASGRIAGFGKTATGRTSGVLQTLTIPYIPYSQCRSSSNAAQNEAFISGDKFCAGLANGSAVCEGDSGGGLMFQKGDLWYVMGIVSLGLGVDIENGGRTCDKYSYSLYTKLPTYKDWIQDVLYHVEHNLPYRSCNDDPKMSMLVSAPPTLPTVYSRLPTVTSSVMTNWWDSKTNIALLSISCSAPPQPYNGQWRLHEKFCAGNVNCKAPDGTPLKPGTRLVYRCAGSDETTNVHCRSDGEWSRIPSCTGLPGFDCECVVYHRCPDLLVKDKDGLPVLDKRISMCSNILDICCPRSLIKHAN